VCNKTRKKINTTKKTSSAPYPCTFKEIDKKRDAKGQVVKIITIG